MSSRLAGKGACACVYARFPTSGFGRCPERTYGRRDVEAAQDNGVLPGFTVIRPCGGCRMWKLYCLPGRVIAELGYLFPGRGQIWASRRRRESGFAAFLFATGFWVVFCIFVVPMIIGMFANVGSAKHRTAPLVAAAAKVVALRASTTSPERPSSAATSYPGQSKPLPALDSPEAAKSVARVVFAAPHEVVEPLPTSAQSTNTANQ